ncbi:phosphate ABC transporter permease subunit PstC [Microlunatus soli]|uniref:Phosphate transport system permease protein n=1 Tax=Microlunatus soli TaxID=630515 RepID=A0A1H1S8L8_9ACTN|nr:phosphate ABC transporter permease subunit PstC [Microlunatus soli]SDS44106.1 phosphate ABC transporter membrane protein 1, PhoT family [Microlunatus soli]
MSVTDRDREGLGSAAARSADSATDTADEALESPVDTIGHDRGPDASVTLRRITPLHADHTHTDPSPPPIADADRPVRFAKIGRSGDRIFRGASLGASLLIIAIVVFVGIFLIALAAPSLAADKVSFLTSREWSVNDPTNLRFGIVDLLWTTVLSSVVAMVIAVPISVGVALFITQYAPKKVSGPLAFVVDLLAAVPSIVFGLWGMIELAPKMTPISDFLEDNLGFIPIFAPGVSGGSTVLTASVVLAIMIVPIVTAISRDVFAQTPAEHMEAALALGATRWEKIRMTVLPYGRSGVVSASMLGLGRALGETIAVMIILSVPAKGESFNPSLLAGGETFASKIANAAAEFDSPEKTGAFIAAGMVLFVVTFAVNAVARLISSQGTVKA